MREELKDVLGRERDEVMERAWKGFREETGKERSLHAKLGDFNAQLRKEEETFECVPPSLSLARYLLSKVWQERHCLTKSFSTSFFQYPTPYGSLQPTVHPPF
jgi:hypothetical protein